MRPLEGVRVLDLALMFAAPGCAMYLADQGADVIKVEPLTGDDSRHTMTAPPIRDGESRAWLVLGRNKRGIALKLGSKAGQEIIHRLVPKFDVVIVNQRPATAARLRIDYDTLHALNPRLIYVQVTAYGEHGPYADRPGFDYLVQSMSGIVSRRRLPDGTPIPAAVYAADCSVPMLMSYGVVLALLMRERTGEGQRVDTSLLQAAIAMQSVDAVRVATEEKGERRDLTRQAMYAPYKAADGNWLIIACPADRLWIRLCHALELDDLADDARFDTTVKRAYESETLHGLLAGIFETRPRDEWLSILWGHEVPAVAVLGQDEIFDHEQYRANGFFVDVEDPWAGLTTMMAAPVRLSASDPLQYRPAPRLGEHTREVLIEAGFSGEEIAGLVRDGIVRCA